MERCCLVLIPAILLVGYLLFDLHFVFHNDVLGYMYPKLTIVQDVLRNGELPIWNSYQGCGTALLTEGGLPVLDSLLLYVVSVKDSIVLAAVMHVLLGLALFYAFARELGISARGALLGATIWVFNGYHAWYANDLCLFGTNLFLPLLLLAHMRSRRGGRWCVWLLAGAAAGACQLLNARPPDVAYAWAVAVMFSLYDTWTRQETASRRLSSGWRPYGRVAGFHAGIFLLALMLAAFFVLPYGENLLKSTRFLGKPQQTAYALPASLAEMFVPNLVRPLYVRPVMKQLLRIPSIGAVVPLGSTGYFGLAVLPFLVASWRARHRYRRFFMVLGAFSLLCVFPFGLFDLLRLLPLHRGAIAAVRFVPPFMLAVAVLAGMGYDRLFSAPLTRRIRLRTPPCLSLRAVVVTGAVLLAALVCLDLAFHRVYWARHPFVGSMVIVALSVLAVTAIRLGWTGRMNERTAFYVFLAALIVTFWVATYSDTSDGDIARKGRELLVEAPKMPVVRYVAAQQEGGLFRVADYREVFSHVLWLRLLVPSVCYYQAAPSFRVVRYFGRLAGEETRAKLRVEKPSSVFYDLANLQFLIVRTDDEKDLAGGKYIRVFHDAKRRVSVYRNGDCLPRLRFVSGFVSAPNGEEALRVLSEKAAEDPAWFRDNAVLMGCPDGLHSEDAAGAEVLEVHYGADEVEVAVNAPRDTILVFADAFDEGWRASVDREPATLMCANYLFRAVAVPAGRHVVRFTYLPRSFVLGCLVSGGGVLIVCVGLVVSAAMGWRARRGGRTHENGAAAA